MAAVAEVRYQFFLGSNRLVEQLGIQPQFFDCSKHRVDGSLGVVDGDSECFAGLRPPNLGNAGDSLDGHTDRPDFPASTSRRRRDLETLLRSLDCWLKREHRQQQGKNSGRIFHLSEPKGNPAEHIEVAVLVSSYSDVRHCDVTVIRKGRVRVSLRAGRGWCE